MSKFSDNEIKEAAIFIGNTLGPLFLYEPLSPENKDLLFAIKELDPKEAAKDWPLADAQDIEDDLALLVGALDAEKEDDLLWEYRRLFVGPSRKAAPPWGSVYTDKDQVIFGQSTLELRKWMREVGIKSVAPEGDPDDHIGLMLLMMSWIAENDFADLAPYLQDHFLTWAPHFLEYMSDQAQGDFYPSLARLSASSLAAIKDALELSVDTPRFYR